MFASIITLNSRDTGAQRKMPAQLLLSEVLSKTQSAALSLLPSQHPRPTHQHSRPCTQQEAFPTPGGPANENKNAARGAGQEEDFRTIIGRSDCRSPKPALESRPFRSQKALRAGTWRRPCGGLEVTWDHHGFGVGALQASSRLPQADQPRGLRGPESWSL